MNWNAIGAVGEMLGALGVIVTLIYLAREIRQNTTATRLSTSRSVAAAAREWNEPLLLDAELAWTFQEGTEVPGVLAGPQGDVPARVPGVHRRVRNACRGHVGVHPG